MLNVLIDRMNIRIHNILVWQKTGAETPCLFDINVIYI